MDTIGVKYIGSKKTIIPEIIRVIKEKIDEPVKSCIDVFTGTTRVAQAFKASGFKTYTSDLNVASRCYANALVHGGSNEHLQTIIDDLNNTIGKEGWLTTTYADVLAPEGTIVRVWQRHNTMIADAIRDEIEKLHTSGDVNQWEYDTLITSLIFALDRVDNTVGVQQAYLKDWCQRSFNNLRLELPPYIKGKTGRHIVGDALKIKYPKADLAYLDPPYTNHSYASYYHIWDSIALWDRPAVQLETNRRVDRVKKSGEYDEDMESEWNYKSKAMDAFSKLIKRLPVKYVLISYNNESIINIDSLIAVAETYGDVHYESFDYKRNIMSTIGNVQLTTNPEDYVTENKELLILITKS